jgi:hypothetical protein
VKNVITSARQTRYIYPNIELIKIINNKIKGGTMWMAWYEEIEYRQSPRGAYEPEWMWEGESKMEKK